MCKFIISLLLFVTTLFAHPHIFIEVYPTIEVKNGKTTKINFVWKIDELTSAMLLMEFDKNSDGKIDKKENSLIFNSYFNKLREDSYYTYIRINKKIKNLPDPKNFKATIENNKLCFSFNIEKQYDIDDTVFDFGDENYYVAIIMNKNFIKVVGAPFYSYELPNGMYRLMVEE